MRTRLYLASTSPARRALLVQSGIEPVLVAPGVDEEAVAAAESERLGRPLDGAELVSLLAVAKARAVADGPLDGAPIDGVVFGGDSAFEVDGRLYGKPHDPEVARERWRRMLAAGGGTLWSGHCVVDRRADGAALRSGGAGRAGTTPPPGIVVDGDTVVAVDSARLTFAADVDPDEVAAYVSTGEPLEVAGAFTIDGRAAAYITRIDGAPSAVVGLSLPMLRSMLRVGFGIVWHDLWTTTANPPVL
jgi:septum formation protein